MVTEKAMELGQALADCAEFKVYQEAKTAFENDPEAVRLLTEYTEKEKELTNKISTVSIEPDQLRMLSEELERLRVKATENPMIGELTKAQIGFDSVMRLVNDTIMTYINPDAKQTSACGGNCSGCSGCH